MAEPSVGKQIAALRRTSEAQEQSLHKALEALTTLQQEGERMATNYAGLKEAMERLTDLVGRAAGELAQLREDLKNQEEEQHQVEDLKQQVEDLEQQLAAVVAPAEPARPAARPGAPAPAAPAGSVPLRRPPVRER